MPVGRPGRKKFTSRTPNRPPITPNTTIIMNKNRGSSVPARGFCLLAVCLSLLSFLAVSAAAQPAASSTLRGVISNQATSLTLEGARITTTAGQSVYSGKDGSYELKNLPPGNVVLTVAYPGLDAVTETISLGEGVTVRNFRLSSDVYVLNDIVVTSPREGNAASIARQEASLILANTISLDAYGNVAKGDLGTFLQRLPGITGEYGASSVNMISVRGMSPEFTTVNIDGNRAALANPDNRTQMVSEMSVDSIDTVEVIKTPTADMSADSLGGVVNLKTRSGFDRIGRSIVLNASASYSDTLREFINPSDDQMYFPQFSLQYADVVTLFGRKLGVTFTGTYQEVAEAPITVRAEFADDWDYTGPTLPRRFLYADHEFHLKKRSDFNARFDYKWSDNTTLSFAPGFTRNDNLMEQLRPGLYDNVIVDTANTTEDYWVFSRFRYRAQRDFRYNMYDTWKLPFSGEHNFDTFSVKWNLSYSSSELDMHRIGATARSSNNYTMVYDRTASKEFPTLTFTGATSPVDDNFANLSQIALRQLDELTTNDILAAKLDVTKEFPEWKVPVVFKTGFQVRQEERDRDYDAAAGTAPGGNYSAYRDLDYTHGWADGRYPATPVLDTQRYFADAGVSYAGNGTYTVQNSTLFPLNVTSTTTDSLINDYGTKETIPAVYFQGEVTLTRKLKATLGLRYEQTRTELRNRTDDVTAPTLAERYGSFVTTEADYGNWFPNVQFRFEPTKRLIMRAAYSTTIGRPRITDLVSRFSVNDVEERISFSNPSLKPQLSRNFDVSVEYYFEPAGVVSVGVFRKDFTNYVTTQTFEVVGDEFGLDLGEYAGWTGTTKFNTGKGKLNGLEFNYSQQFSFLPGYFKGLGMMANYSILDSEGDYNGPGVVLPFDNILPGMRPHSGNFGLSYNYGRFDLRLMCNYTDYTINSLDLSDPSGTEFFGARTQWDFFGRFKITQNTNVFVDVVNMFEENRERYQGLYRYDRLAQVNVFNRVVTVGVQARF